MSLRRRILVVAAVVLGIVLVVGGWLGFRVYQAAGAARDLQAAVDGARPEVDALDVVALQARLPAVQEAAQRMRSASADPVWSAATHLPWVGDDLHAVRAMAVAADDLSHEAAPGLLDALSGADVDADADADDAPGSDAGTGDAGAGDAGTGDAGAGSAGAGDSGASDASSSGTGEVASGVAVPAGWVDLSALVRAAPDIARAAAVAEDLRVALVDLDAGSLVGPLSDPVAQVQRQLDPATLASVRDLADVLPALLGADGLRTYLLLSLNPAELRAQGGIVGSVAVLQARDGAIGLVGQRSTADLPERDTSVLPLSAEEELLYTDRLGRWVQDTVLTPDFPRAAELASAFWTASTGQSVDGVIATDPVTVAALLSATGHGVQVDGVELDADNLLDTLLRDTYLTHGDPRDGDAFYAQVAAAVFGALSDAVTDPGAARAAVAALSTAVDERRMAGWSAHEDEQAALAASAVGGAFLSGGTSAVASGGSGASDGSAASDDSSGTGAGTGTGTGGGGGSSSGAGAVGDAVGLFLDDGTAGKLDYDLTTTVTVTMNRCETGAPTATVTLDLAYDPPADVADLPAQVVGDGGSGLPVGWLATNVSVYSARGAGPAEVRRDGAVVGGLSGAAADRTVTVLTSRLAPGARESWTVTVPAPVGELTVWSTPTLTSPGLTAASCPAG